MTESSITDAARRRLLGRLGAGALLGLTPLGRLLAAAASEVPKGRLSPGYGPLHPVRDLNTDLPLLRLPKGFSYRTFGWAGERLADGSRCPGNHDGMGVVAADGDRLTLIRNHELDGPDGPFGPSDCHYDPSASGGTVTLEFDSARGELLAMRPSLSGTLKNCAGGSTPWGSWLSCEEFVARAGQARSAGGGEYQRDHGFVFEVPAHGLSDARPLRAMGQFRHEAAAVHAASGDVYLTEDTEPTAGFYRFRPKTPGRLADGGRLQMLRAVGVPDLRSGLAIGVRMPVEWVDIAEPERGYDPATGAITGVQAQGRAAGASVFTRLEGCVTGPDEVYFTATNGGDAACGQIFLFRPGEQTLELLVESPEPSVLDFPDNLTTSPRGGLVVCQDSAQLSAQRLYGVSADGALFEFARQNVVLDGAKGFSGDFRRAEWAGACFSPDGRWLFANVYSPGFTVAITGPWQQGLI